MALEKQQPADCSLRGSQCGCSSREQFPRDHCCPWGERSVADMMVSAAAAAACVAAAAVACGGVAACGGDVSWRMSGGDDDDGCGP